MGRGDLAGAAHLELVSGVVQLRPEDAMVEAMLSGWLAEDTMAPRERLVRRFLEFTNEYPWSWGPAHVEEWTQSLTGEQRLAPSTIRGYQTDLRLFSEYLCDARYGWRPPASSPSARIRRRSATSGTRSRTSTTTRAARRLVRSVGRSCSGFSTTPTSRWTARSRPSARARWRPTGTRGS